MFALHCICKLHLQTAFARIHSCELINRLRTLAARMHMDENSTRGNKDCAYSLGTLILRSLAVKYKLQNAEKFVTARVLLVDDLPRARFIIVFTSERSSGDGSLLRISCRSFRLHKDGSSECKVYITIMQTQREQMQTCASRRDESVA